MAQAATEERHEQDHLDRVVEGLVANRDRWARTTTDERIAMIASVQNAVMDVAEDWALEAARQKQIPADSPLVGEEWLSGPYALISACMLLTETLSGIEGKTYLNGLPVRHLESGQIAVKVLPRSIWDKLLFSGIEAEVWMQKGVTTDNLPNDTASTYDTPPEHRVGRVALVLGAGNISSIAPLDCLHKLLMDHQVTLLKLNPVNDYLLEYLTASLKPFIDFGALQIVSGGADVGAALCEQPGIDEIHITGAEASHDAIVWGAGKEGIRNKANGTPRNTRRITSELGAVCPTIVVPGPWTEADLAFQAEHIATQKLHNSGFNCVACQMLVLPDDWNKTDTLLRQIERVMARAPSRPLYYPGADKRMAEFEDQSESVVSFSRPGGPNCLVAPVARGNHAWFETTEVFAPAMNTYRIGGTDPEAYLRAAIGYANRRLRGTLGASILIHPATVQQIGRKKFEALIGELHYGCIAINCWTGVGFLLLETPWGAFPGHTLDDVQSGIDFVHNTFLFDRPERSVIRAPFRPFPRNLLSREWSLLPRPPWFITNRRQHKIGPLLTGFRHRPGWTKLPRIFLNALLG
ncbi:MAG: aldehyde dehydrogenase family protein [Alphaproteobacteria bacterium]|nr:aldehyde dehydrogenase family protein [Alphaproteobacteria bacterium]